MPPSPETPDRPDAPDNGDTAPADAGATDAATFETGAFDAALQADVRRWTRRRVFTGAAAAAGLFVAMWMLMPGDAAPADGPADETTAMERAQWAAMMRRAPRPLSRAGVRDTLGPGDAQGPDDRFSDFYAYAASDSATFSVVVVSADFAPDLAVRRPDGVTVAASTLLRTGQRAEVPGLRGPGRFEIVVTSRDPGATGGYELTAGATVQADTLYVGDEARGDSLGLGALQAGRYERVYGVVTSSDAPVVISVVSADFVPRVSLIGPTGEVIDRTVERVAGDSLQGVLVRYIPGWDAPYRLVVSSEARGARGTFAVEARPLPLTTIVPDGRGIAGTLGDDSWLDGYRYVDTYRFTIQNGMRTAIQVSSDEIAPGYRLIRLDRRDERETAADLNPRGASTVGAEQTLPAGDYALEVTSGGTPTDTTRAVGGRYTLSVRQTPIAPPPRPATPRPATPQPDPEEPAAEPPESRVIPQSVERTGTSGGSTFAVGATQVALSYPRGRTRVQVSVSVRSVDYTGDWAPWSRFASRSYLVDDDGRRYTASPGESASPSGPRAEPGTVRRGTVVFYGQGTRTGQSRFQLVASIGASSVTVPLPVR